MRVSLYRSICDICEAPAEGDFPTLEDARAGRPKAVAGTYAEGWRSRFIPDANDYGDVCPACVRRLDGGGRS